VKALTIWQPWAACIAHGPKRVENRTWRPPLRWRLPFDLAIHAAARRRVREESEELDGIEFDWPEARTAPLDRGCVIAVASVVGFRLVKRGLLLPADADPWETGPVCWDLDNVRTLAEPVPCRGEQGLWTLPPEVERKVLAMEGRG
jgi:hypothetical protein